MPTTIAGIQWAAFHPHGTDGGGYAPDGRLIADSGVFNLDLLKKNYGEKAARLFDGPPPRPAGFHHRPRIRGAPKRHEP